MNLISSNTRDTWAKARCSRVLFFFVFEKALKLLPAPVCRCSVLAHSWRQFRSNVHFNLRVLSVANALCRQDIPPRAGASSTALFGAGSPPVAGGGASKVVSLAARTQCWSGCTGRDASRLHIYETCLCVHHESWCVGVSWCSGVLTRGARSFPWQVWFPWCWLPLKSAGA